MAFLCFSALSSGKWSTKWVNVGVFWFTKHKGQPKHSGGGDGLLSHVSLGGGKLDIWQRLLVWSLNHNSTPPITVFQRTTIASTIITQSRHSFSPWKPPWPQAHGGVCSPWGGHYWLQGDTMENPSHEAGHLTTAGLPGASCTCYGSSDRLTPQGNSTFPEDFLKRAHCLVHVLEVCFC